MRFNAESQRLLLQIGETEERLLERPFAYELYHQMRCLWAQRHHLISAFPDVVTQGEFDKGYQDIPG